MVILSVKFKSILSDDEVRKVMEERIDSFRSLPGLLQKYYGYEPATGEFTGIYIWDSMESLKEYRESELARTIPEAYKAASQPRIEVFTVEKLLRE